VGGLSALIFLLLVAVFVGAQFVAPTSVHAQTPAATKTPAAPAAAEAPRLRCRDAGEMHAELRRYRLDVQLGG
jgi:hypothetical protein